MNKLLQTTLIAAVLSTSVMASINHLPNTIETGATVYINTDVYGETVENYGTIDTEVTSDPYPKLGYATINNHVGQALEETSDNGLITANPVDGVTKVYEIGGYTGSISPKIVLENTTVNTVNDSTALDFKSLSATDLVSLSTVEPDKSISIIGPSGGTYHTISCHFGDQGSSETNSYNMKLSGFLTFNSNLSNYKNGSIEIPKDTTNVHVCLKPGELRVPVTVSANSAAISNTDIYSNVTVKNGADLQMWGNVTLKPGAVLKIGEA